jgi:hypothetical protein
MGGKNGFSLIELTLALGIGFIVIGLGNKYFSFTQFNLKEIQTTQGMRQVAKYIQGIIKRPEAVAFSASLEPQGSLAICAFPPSLGGDTLCTQTDSNHQDSFELFLPPKKKKDFKRNRALVAGTEKKPVYYTASGQPGCDPKSPGCVFKAIAYFWATCPGDSRDFSRSKTASLFQKDCARAQVLNLRFQVSYITEQESKPSIPSDDGFWQDRSRTLHTPNYAVAIPTAALGRYADYIQSCPKNYSLLGVIDSKPQCQCLPPYRELTKDVCIQENHRCLPTERYLGTALNGKPICKKLTCTEKVITGDARVSFDFDCAPDGWLNKIQVLGKNPKNCRCIDDGSGSNLELRSWRAVCRLDCGFKITCCRE